MRDRKCKQCGVRYAPQKTLQQVCSLACSIPYGREMKEKHENKKHRDRKKAIKPLSKHLSETQVVFNRFIRLRDRDQPCIACQRFHTGQYHAGHYRPRGQNAGLRFSELNTHKQCAPCNNHKSGNLSEYRVHLIEKIGLDMVEWLEAQNEPKKWTIEECDALKKYYRHQIKDLQEAVLINQA